MFTAFDSRNRCQSKWTKGKLFFCLICNRTTELPAIKCRIICASLNKKMEKRAYEATQFYYRVFISYYVYHPTIHPSIHAFYSGDTCTTARFFPNFETNDLNNSTPSTIWSLFRVAGGSNTVHELARIRSPNCMSFWYLKI